MGHTNAIRDMHPKMCIHPYPTTVNLHIFKLK